MERYFYVVLSAQMIIPHRIMDLRVFDKNTTEKLVILWQIWDNERNRQKTQYFLLEEENTT
jgi:hypothetical protein